MEDLEEPLHSTLEIGHQELPSASAAATAGAARQ